MMANVAEPFLLPLEEEEDEEEEEDDDDVEDFYFEGEDSVDLFVPIFPSHLTQHQQYQYQELDSEYIEHDPITLSLDHHFEDSADFSVLDLHQDIMGASADYLGLGLELGLHQEEQEQQVYGFVEEDEQQQQEDGLRVVHFDSDSDSQEEVDDQDLVLPLCFDCLRLQDEYEQDFEWEEVEGSVVLDEHDVLSMMVGSRTEEEDQEQELDDEEEYYEDGGARAVEWEVLTGLRRVTSIEMEPEEEDAVINDPVDLFSPLEDYEVLFGQLAEDDASVRGTPPASKSVVKNLPSVLLTEEDVANNNTACAICKDEISLVEKAKKLPCSHHYHTECILPWLGIRNTCPVCRFELLTDDPDYESWKVQRRVE